MNETKLIKIHIILFIAIFIFILLMPLLISGFFNKTEKEKQACGGKPKPGETYSKINIGVEI